MNNLLNKLIELDKKAQLLDQEIKSEVENLEATLQKEIEADKMLKMQAAEETIAKETAELKAKAEKEWQNNSDKYHISRQRLEENFNNNFDKWVDMVVSDVLA